MIRKLHNYEIHRCGRGLYVIRQGQRIFATYGKLSLARGAVYALARGDARRMVTGFQKESAR